MGTRFSQAKFIKSAVKPGEYPPPIGREIAFVGPSNVGKSSLINALFGKKLAHTSSSPGRTRLLNFFLAEENLYFVDLPGYGFARVSKEERKQWQTMIEEYLLNRKALALVVALLDARREPSDRDVALVEWLNHNQIPFIVALTKSDKISKSARGGLQKQFAKLLSMQSESVFTTSAETKEGIFALLREIDNKLK